MKYYLLTVIKKEKLEEALECKLDCAGFGSITIRQYLHRLLADLWEQQESFNSKRPFGNSGWERDLLRPLCRDGFLDLGQLDDDYSPFNPTRDQKAFAHNFIHDLISTAFFNK
jgi:hypothetical protein